MERLQLLAQQQDKFNNCEPTDESRGCLSLLPQVTANENQLQKGLGIVFGVFAAVAVIIIIVAAINFATSEGNPETISKSKKTIIYAMIGLIISLSAEAIVWTVLGRL